ncbi:hypothetical protein LX64_01420 [Chitinophaga skermanii]|uniref:Natural product n=1 Tax=Chitinophaga skermanii TaxID=331697 RepID=A0A327QVS5_9BACT|nr:class I lanthipeptide [Chitinophaga skermanii]RAJ08766.1 hypothetical protein LX64_01420 [Chitinophaga skermanii]
MKKKKLQLSKLNFDKAVIAVLNQQAQDAIVGGAATMTTRCQTEPQTCQTIHYTERLCVFCASPTEP